MSAPWQSDGYTNKFAINTILGGTNRTGIEVAARRCYAAKVSSSGVTVWAVGVH